MQRKYQGLMKFQIEDDAVLARMGEGKHKQLDEIIVLMSNSNVFNGTEEENKERYELLIRGSSRVTVRGVTKFIVNGKEEDSFFANDDDEGFADGHNIENLLAVYRLLAEKQVLTPFVHKQLMGMLKGTWLHLGKTKKYFDKCAKHGEMNQSLVNGYFEDPFVSVTLLMSLDKHDPDGSAFAYLLNHCNLEGKKFIRRYFDEQTGGGDIRINTDKMNWLYYEKKWMTVDVIKAMADYAFLCPIVLPIFVTHCNNFKLYSSKNIEDKLAPIVRDLFLLKKNGLPLSDVLFKMMLSDIFPGKAVAICCDADYLGDFKQPVYEKIYLNLFSRRDLIAVLTKLYDIQAQCSEAGIHIDKTELHTDIHHLFKTPNGVQGVIAKVGGLFSSTSPESLAAASSRLFEKYESRLKNNLRPI